MCQACGNSLLVHHAEAKKIYDDFVNLHLHTSYSLLDGLSKPEDVIKKVASLKQKSVAITEHGNTFSAVKAHKLAKEAGIKHIYGAEFYVTENRFLKDKDKKYYHLTVLAKNEKGRLNINKLASLGYLEGFYFKPRIDHELLEKYSEGLIIMSGCMASEVQQALAGGKIGDGDINITEYTIANAKKIVKWYRNVFGEDYYLEVQAHRDYRQQKLNRAICDLGIELEIDVVATTDSHFIDEDDHELHSIFIQIGTNREAGETYEDTHIMGAKEVIQKLQSPLGLSYEEAEKATKMSLVISDKCNAQLPLSEPIIPQIDVPEGYDTEIQYLQQLINEGWKKRRIYKKSKEDIIIYRERLMYEFDAIAKMGFEGYFLFVHSYVNSVRRRGIARGSAGGSLIAYLLSITEIDPIPYGLYFERFIDVSAVELLESGAITKKELKIPDVDSDFSKKDREKVVDFIIKRYGQEKFANLGSFQYIWDKSAIKDVGRVLDVPYAIRNKITQTLGDATIEYALETGMLSEYVEEYPKLFEYAKKLAGIPKSFSTHACGKVVTIQDIDWYMPVAVSDKGITIQGDMHDAEDLGMVKADVLGLKSLDVIYDCLDMISKDYDYISPDLLDFTDPKVLGLFRSGATDGIFQFESNGMKEMLRKMQPDGIEDLGVANALFRPASMKFIDHYAKRKFGEEEIEYLHPDLEEVLGKTYGIFVYQEQLITLGRLAGMRNPDLLRQATAKKNMEKMKKARKELFEGLINRGWNEEQLETLWQVMLDFASYSFNQSHAVAYAIIAYQMAKLKAYHPVEFMTALLNSKINKIEEVSHYVSECKRMGIEVLLPDINDSEGEFTIKDGKILFGLIGIKTVGEPTVQLIKDYRNLYGKPFKNLEDFYTFASTKSKEVIHIDKEGNEEFATEMLPTDALINLIKSGAFGSNIDEMLERYANVTYTPLKWKNRMSAPSRADLTKFIPTLTAEEFKKMSKPDRISIFNRFKYDEHLQKDATRKQKHINEFKEKYVGDREMYEFNTMGCFLTISPFDRYINSIKDFYSFPDGQDKVLIVGTIIKKEVKKSSRGGQYAKLSILTPHGVVQGKCYSTQYSEFKKFLDKGETIVLLAKRQKDEFILSKLKTFDEWKEIINKKKELKERKQVV